MFGHKLKNILYFVTGGEVAQENRHSQGFDPEDLCKVGNGSTSANGNGDKMISEKLCCNEYPVRFPFKTYGGARECCVDATYDTNLYACCADGVVRILGTC